MPLTPFRPFTFVVFDDKAKKTLAHIAQDLSMIRTGRASVQMLDGVTVEAYGTIMKLNEVANVESPTPQQLTISPWDKSLIAAVEKAIMSGGLNLNPVVSSDHLFINIPPLTQERRLEMVKLLGQKLEAGKVMVRTLRADTKKDIEKQKGEGGVSEDDITAQVKQLEDKTKKLLEDIDLMGKAKEKELMTI
jgi:ribosome recycling factor